MENILKIFKRYFNLRNFDEYFGIFNFWTLFILTSYYILDYIDFSSIFGFLLIILYLVVYAFHVSRAINLFFCNSLIFMNVVDFYNIKIINLMREMDEIIKNNKDLAVLWSRNCGQVWPCLIFDLRISNRLRQSRQIICR